MADGVKITGRRKKNDSQEDDKKKPYVVIGFEVNQPGAFTQDKALFMKHWVHHLNVDYGHGFFYVVDEHGKVVRFFSFGPAGPGKIGWFNSGDPKAAPIKDGSSSSRPGTPDYPISEATRLFRIMLTKDKYEKLIRETDKERARIISGKHKYTAWVNDTCAESARDVLSAAGIATPSGAGFISAPPVKIYAVTPYKWHYNFKKEGFKEARIGANDRKWEIIMKNARNNKLADSDPAATQW